MSIQLFQARVSRVRDLTHDVREIDLALIDPKEIRFRAGQFISFEVPGSAGRRVIRPYSIASPPSRSDTVTLVFNLVPNGPGSTYLFGLREHDRVVFKGVAGNFYLREDFGRDQVFVATGTGIAPIRSMLLDLSDRSEARAVLYWGLRSERDLYYVDELEAWARTYPRFEFAVTLSQPLDGWTGHRGRVTRLIEERLTSVANLSVYLCGNSGMIRDVTELINRKGICPIYREKYYDDHAEEADY